MRLYNKQTNNDKFQNKYRIKSTRLPNYDYSQNGVYFITICTKNRINHFREIVNEKMELLEMGKIAKKYWLKIPNHFLRVKLGEFVIMPNHVHGIIFIDNDDNDNIVETQNFASLQQQSQQINKFGPQSKNLASIIRGFKIGVKKYATINNINFIWQPRFYDHIIRNENELNHISEYIINNPINWQKDDYYFALKLIVF